MRREHNEDMNNSVSLGRSSTGADHVPLDLSKISACESHHVVDYISGQLKYPMFLGNRKSNESQDDDKLEVNRE